MSTEQTLRLNIQKVRHRGELALITVLAKPHHDAMMHLLIHDGAFWESRSQSCVSFFYPQSFAHTDVTNICGEVESALPVMPKYC